MIEEEKKAWCKIWWGGLGGECPPEKEGGKYD